MVDIYRYWQGLGYILSVVVWDFWTINSMGTDGVDHGRLVLFDDDDDDDDDDDNNNDGW